MRFQLAVLLAFSALAPAQPAEAPAKAPAEAPAKPPAKSAAHAFMIDRVGAAPISLSAYRGKLVMLVFINTECSHCQEFTEKLIPIAKEYGPRGVQFIECAVNGDALLMVPGFVDRFHPPFPVGYNTDRPQVEKFLGRQILYVPSVTFLSRTGKIVGDYPGESDFMKNGPENTRAELDKLLKPAPPRAKKAAAKPGAEGSK